MSMNEAYYADCEQIEQLMFLEKNSPRIEDQIPCSFAAGHLTGFEQERADDFIFNESNTQK